MIMSTAYAQTADPVAHDVAATAGEHSAGVFPPFDFTFFGSHLFWLVISFGIFYFLMARVIVPRIGSIIETRRDRVASDLDQAARMKQEADTAVEAYEKELSEARSRASAIAQTANDEAKSRSAEERKAVEASLEKKLAAAEKRIGEIRDRAMQDVGTIAADTASAIVQELIGGSVDKSQLTKAVKEVRD